jgi:hypothetical protein
MYNLAYVIIGYKYTFQYFSHSDPNNVIFFKFLNVNKWVRAGPVSRSRL